MNRETVSQVKPSIRSILAITDFSAGARRALLRTAMLVDELGIERGQALHVLEKSLLDGLRRLFSGSSESTEAFEQDAARTLARQLAELEGETGVALSPLVRSGRPLEAVLDVAADFDLLAIGARGQHRNRKLALGTTSRALLRAHRKPVLMVRRVPRRPYRRVLVALDFSDYSMRAVDWARAVAPDAHLYLVHCFDNPVPRSSAYVRVSHAGLDKFRRRVRKKADNRMEQTLSELAEIGQPVTGSIEVGEPGALLVDRAEALEAELLVIGKHARPPTEHFLLGSVTLRVLDKSRCDVLVVQ